MDNKLSEFQANSNLIKENLLFSNPFCGDTQINTNMVEEASKA
jgi:hypothetical protein